MGKIIKKRRYQYNRAGQTMNVKYYSVITYFLIFVFFSSVLYSQEAEQSKTMITISSNPNGAYIEMTGEYLIRGVTPLKIPYILNGSYMIKANRYGFEKFSTRYDFSGQNRSSFKFNLTSKSRSKAALRSILFPGWGQYYSDRKFSATILSAMEIGSILYFIKKETDYNKIVTGYDKLLKRYKNQNLSFENRESLKIKLIEEEKKADDAYEQRQRWIYMSVTIWIYNILDSMFLFNFDQLKSMNEIVPRLAVQMDMKQISVNFKWDF